MSAYLHDLAVVVWAMRWHLLALSLVVTVACRVVSLIERRR